MSKSRSKKYYVEDEDYDDRNRNKRRYEDRRKNKKMKAALLTKNLQYFEQDDE